jgi:ABC-type Na+ efflux pump permease subunit
LLALTGREWRVAWGDRGGYFLRALYAGALLAGGALMGGVLGVLGPVRLEEFAEFSRLVFGVFFRSQAALALFLATIAFARAVSREKEQGTMDFLLLSPLPRAQILLGKVLGEIFGMAAVLAAGLPVLFFVLPVGGMTLGEILAAQAILLGALFALGGLCAALGAWFARSAQVMMTAWGILLLVVAPPVVRFLWPRWTWTAHLPGVLSPFEVLDRELASVGADLALALGTLAAGAGISVGLCVLGGWVLERRHARAGERSGRRGFWKSLGGKMVRAASGRRTGFLFRPFFGARDPLVRRECGLERDGVFRAGWLFFVALYGVGVWAVFAYDTDWENQVALAGVGGLAALLLATLLASVSVSADRRRGVFETLLAANVEPEDILKARLAGLLVRGAYLLLPAVIHGAISVCLAGDLSPGVLAWRIPIGVAAVGFGLATATLGAVHTALLTRRPEVAAVAAVLTSGPAAAAVACFLGAAPVLFAVGVPAVSGMLLGAFAQMTRVFRRAALAP